jgi:hypothetical protein
MGVFEAIFEDALGCETEHQMGLKNRAPDGVEEKTSG